MDSDSIYVEEAENLAPPSAQAILPLSPPRITVSPIPEPNTSVAASPIPQRIVPSLISENPYAQGDDAETYFSRPNRFFGPASTWLSWTKEARTVALSLDRERSQDLSIHLFSAYSLKREAELPLQGNSKRQKGKRRDFSLPSTPGQENHNEYQPPNKKSLSRMMKSWTAWPMPPDQVPREELLPPTSLEGAHRANVGFQPSADLEEWLVATATRFARERWESRKLETQSEAKQSIAPMQNTNAVELATASDVAPDEADDENEEEEAGQDMPPLGDGEGQEIFFSQPAKYYDEDDSEVPDSIKGEESADDTAEIGRRPVPLADDERARNYFLPSARHILSKLDDLFLGLHKTRYAYVAKPLRKERGRYSQSRTPESHSRSRSHSRPASKRGGRSTSVDTDVSGISAASGGRSRRIDALGLRDWADVMGMASMTGWDPAVVERASARCEQLKVFVDESIREKHGEMSHAEHAAAQGRFAEAAEQPTAGAETGNEGETLMRRISKPCEACQATKSDCQPADEQMGSARTCKQCMDTKTTCSGIKVGMAKHERVCPHRSCPRHLIPFRKQYHLQRHLNSMHSSTNRSRSKSKSVDLSNNDLTDSDVSFEPIDTDSQDTMYQIVCPVPDCPRSTTRPFSKGKKLYEHLRRMHPDVDVDEVKKLEARKRGERRQRSRLRGNARSSRSQSRNRMSRGGSRRLDEEGESSW